MRPQVDSGADPVAALAGRFVQMLHERPALFVAFSGGNTPRALFQHLLESEPDAPWERLHVYQVDERMAPPDHADSNWRMIHESFLSRVRVASAHRIEAECGAAAAAAYETAIRATVPAGGAGVPELDLVLLGMGADGHTASLFPGTAALAERTRWVVYNEVPQLNAGRITMTYPLLDAARERWFLVTGDDKRAAFDAAMRGEGPAGRITAAEWFVPPEWRRP